MMQSLPKTDAAAASSGVGEPAWGAVEAPYAAAVQQARSGRYASAEALLEAARTQGGCSELEALDLQARMLAQQGRYLEAEACWRQAKNIDDTNPAFDDALARLRAAHRPNRRFLVWLASAAGLLLVGALAWRTAVLSSATHEGMAATRAAVQAMQVDVHELQASSRQAEQNAILQRAALEDASGSRDSQKSANQELGRQLVKMETRVQRRLAKVESVLSAQRERVTNEAGVSHGDLAAQVSAFADANAQLQKRLAELSSSLDQIKTGSAKAP